MRVHDYRGAWIAAYQGALDGGATEAEAVDTAKAAQLDYMERRIEAADDARRD
jgi:hypothetical protein